VRRHRPFRERRGQADKLEAIQSAGVVRIGVPLDVPPFGYQDASRNAVGFDVELAQMIGDALGVRTELQQITGANRIPYLLTDRVDIVISVMGLTPERAKQIMFTAPYANTFLAVYGAASAEVTAAEEVGSLRIAAARGTTQEITLTEMNRMPTSCAPRTTPRRRRPISGPGRPLRHQQHRGAVAGRAEPECRVRQEVRHPPQPGPHGRAHGRAQPAPLARFLHLLQHHERRAGAAAPDLSRHADGPAADALN
jgi:hypothetical protein